MTEDMDRSGYHQFQPDDDGEGYGSFLVFRMDSADTTDYNDDLNEDDTKYRVGWYWVAQFPGCMPDGEPSGPFDTSFDAYADAQEYS